MKTPKISVSKVQQVETKPTKAQVKAVLKHQLTEKLSAISKGLVAKAGVHGVGAPPPAPNNPTTTTALGYLFYIFFLLYQNNGKNVPRAVQAKIKALLAKIQTLLNAKPSKIKNKFALSLLKAALAGAGSPSNPNFQNLYNALQAGMQGGDSKLTHWLINGGLQALLNLGLSVPPQVFFGAIMIIFISGAALGELQGLISKFLNYKGPPNYVPMGTVLAKFMCYYYIKQDKGNMAEVKADLALLQKTLEAQGVKGGYKTLAAYFAPGGPFATIVAQMFAAKPPGWPAAWGPMSTVFHDFITEWDAFAKEYLNNKRMPKQIG